MRNRARPRRSAAHWASTICQPGKVDELKYRSFLALEVGERAQRLLDVGLRLGPMDLIQVDVVGAEPAQAVLHLAHYSQPGVAPLVDALPHVAVHLAREHDVVAAALQRTADDLLGLPGRVHVGRVDEVDAAVDGGVDVPHAVVHVGVAPPAEHHRAEAVRARR